MFFDNDGMGNGKTLTGTSADFFRGKERIKNLISDRFGDPAAGVFNADLYLLVNAPGLHGNGAFGRTALSHDIANGVRRIDHHIEDHLVDIANETGHIR